MTVAEEAEVLVAVFAAVQIVVVLWQAAITTAQRIEDDRARRNEALSLARAEETRLSVLANLWEENDLLRLAASGGLRADLLHPEDWHALLRALSTLSLSSGRIGGMAMSLAMDTAAHVQELNALIVRARAMTSSDAPPDTLAEIAGRLDSATEGRVRAIRRGARELADLLEDAIEAAPASRERFRFALPPEPKSEIVRALKANVDAPSRLPHWAQR